MQNTCQHHECKCARAFKLAEMGLTPEAVRVHEDSVKVKCLKYCDNTSDVNKYNVTGVKET